MSDDYYVYVYIDPRNLEEFYYGKGKGSRKSAHLQDVSDSEKSRRIKNIKEAGLEPTVRVIASNLTEQEALLVEATLKIGEKRLLDLDLVSKTMGSNSDDSVNSEYVALVEWLKTVPREQAKWKRRSGLYTPQRVRASLDNQPTTIEFIEREFGVDVRSLIV